VLGRPPIAQLQGDFAGVVERPGISNPDRQCGRYLPARFGVLAVQMQ
jgi:hypothetical protein